MVVTDSLNDRVLIFNPPFTTEENASIVLGQSSFTTYATGTTASTLSDPTNATVDSSGNLWVTDFGNSRILEYTAPFSNGMSASVVIGQANFTDGGTSATASTMNSPAGSTFDSSGHLWVSDYDNNRVLRFTPPFSNGMSADLVLGQANFTAHTCTTGASGLCEPWVGVRFDSNGNLWVADYGHCRVLEYMPPFSTNMAASVAIGQANLTNSGCGTTATTNDGPWSIDFDSSGNLWLADGYDSRVLEFNPPFTTGMAASVVLGQTDFTSDTANITASGLDYPSDIPFDSAGNVYVSDYGNNRVLKFSPPFTTGMSASIVIGQANFTSDEYNLTNTLTPAANTLYAPYGVLILP